MTRWRLILAWAGSLSRKERMGYLVGGLFMIVIMLAVAVSFLPRWREANGQTNFGFGPEWNCTDTGTLSGGSNPICFKKRPVPSESGGADVRPTP